MTIPITKPYFDGNEYNYIKETLNSEMGRLAQGEMTEKFEKEVAEHEGIKYAVAVSSCTTALHFSIVGEWY